MITRIFSLLVLTVTIFFAGNIPSRAESWDDLVSLTPQELKIREDILKDSETLLLASRFDELDRIANQYRTSKEMFTDGEWKLSVFYEGLSLFLKQAHEDVWQKRLDRLNEWVKTRPQSITARVALAECLVGYAFHGRSGNYSNNVDEYQRRLFFDRLKMAADVLLKARTLKQKCPGWWASIQRVALGLEMDRSEYENLFNEAVAFEPKYNAFYYRKAWHLLPRWFGEEGEWERFARTAADYLGGKEGDALYARIIWYMDRRGNLQNLMIRNPNISWNRVFKGIEAIKSLKSSKP